MGEDSGPKSVNVGGDGERLTKTRNEAMLFSSVNIQAEEMVKQFNALMDEVNSKLNAIAQDVAELETKFSTPTIDGNTK